MATVLCTNPSYWCISSSWADGTVHTGPGVGQVMIHVKENMKCLAVEDCQTVLSCWAVLSIAIKSGFQDSLLLDSLSTGKLKPIICSEHDFTYSLTQFRMFSYILAIEEFMTIVEICIGKHCMAFGKSQKRWKLAVKQVIFFLYTIKTKNSQL